MMADKWAPSQGITKIAATALGGSPNLTGNFILCDRDTAVSQRLWSQEPNIGVVVNCIGERFGDKKVHYPAATSQNKVEVFYIECSDKGQLPEAFKRTVEPVRKALEAGRDVLVHCKATYHRAPVVYAGLQTCVCGVGYKVCKHYVFIIVCAQRLVL
jgi:hypothetical protein